MKVLQINKYHHLKGGSETVYFNTSDLLTKHGHSVVHFSMDDEKNLDSPTKEFFPKNFDLRNDKLINRLSDSIRFFYNNEARKKLEQLIIREKPDIAQIHNFNNSLSSSIFQALKKHNIPVVLTFHDYLPLCPSSDFRLKGKICDQCRKNLHINCIRYECYQNDRLYSTMLTLNSWLKEYFLHLDKYVDQYLFVSDFQRNAYLSYHDYYRSKQNRLYNFNPDLHEIKPDYVRGNYFFFYGRITEEKGIRTLIKVASELKGTSFKIAGEGPISDELKALNLPNVEFLGFQTGDTLKNSIKNASFVIVPSEWNENNPLTIIEAYALGKPIIASRIGGIPEILIENETGYLFEMKVVNELKTKIQQAGSLPDDDYLRLSKNARIFAEKNFDAEQYYRQLMVIYKKSMTKKKLYENF
ncbi:MAG: glycosyltransferase [Dysgonamonadaceae bacterium]|nr:glycosyltransferase [Dysgonamonadaceae bacterium]